MPQSEMPDWKRGRNAGPALDLEARSAPKRADYAANVARHYGDERTEAQMRVVRALDGSRYDLTPPPELGRSSGSGKRKSSRGRRVGSR